MKSVNEITVLIHDGGLFLPMALRMAEECKRVIYYNPDRDSFPSLKQGAIGLGFEQIESATDPFSLLKEVDLMCFPDCHDAGLQEHCEEMGIATWGSRRGIELENGRETFMDFLKEVGLPVPQFEVKVGVRELADYLKDKEDVYVKISRWRGDMETTHWRKWDMDRGWIDWLAVNFGPFADYIRFLCFDKIETKLEIGGDTYSIDGQWPSLMLNGIEGKDKCYLSAVTEHHKMPDQIQEIIQAISLRLKEYRYRNQISFEDRVTEDSHFWIDATMRGGMPSTASQHKLWTNFPDIVWHGANGILIDPIPAAQFSIECMITSKPNKDWEMVEIAKELEPWARFSNCCFVDGCYGFPPNEFHSGDLGWLVAIGDTPTETLEEAKRLSDLLPDGLNADVESLSEIIKEVDQMDKADIPFTEKPMPEVAEVLE